MRSRFPRHDSGRVFRLRHGCRGTVGTDQDDAAANTERAALWQEAQQLAAAVWQVSQMNQTEDIEAATAALTEARKAIYRRLAE